MRETVPQQVDHWQVSCVPCRTNFWPAHVARLSGHHAAPAAGLDCFLPDARLLKSPVIQAFPLSGLRWFESRWPPHPFRRPGSAFADRAFDS